MKFPEYVDYVAFLRFDGNTGRDSDEFMAKVIVCSKIQKAALGVGLKSGIAELDFTIEVDTEWDEIHRIALETGGVEIIGIYPRDEIYDEDIKISEKQDG